MSINRRKLLKSGSVAALLLGSGSTVQAKEPEFTWNMVMSWPKKFPGLGTSAEWFVDTVKKMTNGRLQIKLFGAGELVPPFEVFNAVSDGTAEMGHGTAYYWKGIIPEAEIFTSVPFGLGTLEYNSWYQEGDGGKLQRELYKPFGVIPFLAGNSDFQMGGWFNRKINNLSDLKGLKIRMVGIGAEVFQRAGATTVAMPGTDIFNSMNNGVIDAADWVGPWNDQAFGLQRVAKYYYGGWQEPSAATDLLINEKAWNSLPSDIQHQLAIATEALNQHMLNEFRLNNGRALQALKKQGIEVHYFPDDVIDKLQSISAEYLNQYAAQSDMAKKIWHSYRAFLDEQIALASVEQKMFSYRN